MSDDVNEAGVVAIDIDRRLVILDTGERCQITNMIGYNLEETDESDKAVILVFQIKSIEKWWTCQR